MFISLDSFIIFLFRYKLSNRMNSTTIDPDKLDYLPLTQVICDYFHFKYMKLVGHWGQDSHFLCSNVIEKDFTLTSKIL